jgi:hypothetical protein
MAQKVVDKGKFTMSESETVKSCLNCKYSADHPIWVWSCEHPDDSILSDVEISDPSQMTEELAQEWAQDCPGYEYINM